MSTVAKVVLLRQSEPEIQDLAGQLSGFWAADQWDMAQCPLLPAGTSIGHIYVKFDCPSASLNTELKYACWRK